MKITFENNNPDAVYIKHKDGDINFNPKSRLELDIEEGAIFIMPGREDDTSLFAEIKGIKRPS